MYHLKFTFILVLTSATLSAQNFSNKLIAEGIGSFAVGDFTGDGLDDIIAIAYKSTTDDLILYKNSIANPGAFAKTIITKDYDVKSNLDVVDIDKDGDKDFVFSDASGIYAMINDGTGLFTYSDLNLKSVTQLGSGDTDGDGDIDLCGINTSTKKVYSFQRGSDGKYENNEIASNNQARTLAVADVKGNNKADIIISYPSGSDEPYVDYFAHFSADNYTTNPINFSGVENYNGLAFFDMNKDKYTDIVFPCKGAIYIVQIDKDVKTTVKKIKTYSGSKAFGYTGAVGGDFNGDGHADLVATDQEDIFFLKNDGTGVFSEEKISTVAPAFLFRVADIDNDKDLDVVTTNDDLWALVNLLPQLPSASKEIYTLSSNTIEVFPSIARDEITIETLSQKIKVVKIYDSNGKLANEVFEPSSKINVSKLQAGSYYMKVEIGGKVYDGRFVKI